MATDHQSAPASVSGQKPEEDPERDGSLAVSPKMVSSMRSMAKLAAASSSKMTPAVTGQSFIASGDCSQSDQLAERQQVARVHRIR